MKGHSGQKKILEKSSDLCNREFVLLQMVTESMMPTHIIGILLLFLEVFCIPKLFIERIKFKSMLQSHCITKDLTVKSVWLVLFV